MGFAGSKTMAVAQRLYEGVEIGMGGAVGLMTYMRTDSTRVAADALTAERAHIAETYQDGSSPRSPGTRPPRTRRRPTRPSGPPTSSANPRRSSSYLAKDQLRALHPHLEPFLASQMRPAVYDETVVDIAPREGEKGRPALPAPRQGLDPQVQGFPGRLRRGPRREGLAEAHRLAEGPGRRHGPRRLRYPAPPLAEGDALALRKLDTDQHFTQPPPRFSEAVW